MRVDASGVSYEWIENWAETPDPELSRTAWPHSAIGASRQGAILAFHPARSSIVVYDQGGRIQRAVPAPVAEAHGMTLVEAHSRLL